MDIEQIYAAVVDGTGAGDDLAWTRRDLRQMALHHAKTGEPDARLGALKVAALLGPLDGLPIAHQLVTDPDPRVRTLAFNQAIAARTDGIPTIRAAAAGNDPSLAAEAFDLLIRWVDHQSVALGWRGIGSPHAEIRMRSATLLGHVAGPGVSADLRRMAESDPDEAVRAAAAEALDRIGGKLPKGVHQPWWNEPDERTEAGSPEPGADEAATDEALPAGPSEAAQRLLPAATAAAAEPDPSGEPGPSGEPALPAELPTETRPLLRLLGMVARPDRGVVIEALAAAADWSERMVGWRSGGDPALGRGLARSAAALGRVGAVSKLVSMLDDPDPSVRAASAEALGALGSAGTIPSLAARFVDPDPAVAAAAVRALAELAVRIDRRDVGRDQLARVGAGVPAEVSTALAEAKVALGQGGT